MNTLIRLLAITLLILPEAYGMEPQRKRRKLETTSPANNAPNPVSIASAQSTQSAPPRYAGQNPRLNCNPSPATETLDVNKLDDEALWQELRISRKLSKFLMDSVLQNFTSDNDLKINLKCIFFVTIKSTIDNMFDIKKFLLDNGFIINPSMTMRKMYLCLRDTLSDANNIPESLRNEASEFYKNFFLAEELFPRLQDEKECKREIGISFKLYEFLLSELVPYFPSKKIVKISNQQRLYMALIDGSPKVCRSQFEAHFKSKAQSLGNNIYRTKTALFNLMDRENIPEEFGSEISALKRRLLMKYQVDSKPTAKKKKDFKGINSPTTKKDRMSDNQKSASNTISISDEVFDIWKNNLINERKIISTKDFDTISKQVLSVITGRKCVDYGYLSLIFLFELYAHKNIKFSQQIDEMNAETPTIYVLH